MVGAVGSVRPGGVVAAGTGAVAFATDFDRMWRRVDGWGHVLGDRGSSAWVGLQALEAALLTLDGVAAGGEALLAAATEQLGPPETWPRLAMTRPDAVAVIAGLAPAVTALAPSDDGRGPDLRPGRSRAGPLPRRRGGGHRRGYACRAPAVSSSAAPVREAFDAEVASLGLEVQPPAGTGLDGAVLLAEHLAAGRELAVHAAYLQGG